MLNAKIANFNEIKCSSDKIGWIFLCNTAKVYSEVLKMRKLFVLNLVTAKLQFPISI